MTKRKQTERERFEAWACKQSCLMEAEVLANIAWMAWQAAVRAGRRK